MKRAVRLLVFALSLFCLATPFCSSETISSLSDTRYKEQRSKGEIDFEVFRQISTGMTKEEVLKLAGQPAQLYNGTCDDAGRKAKRLLGRGSWQCWTYYYDSWEVQLLLESGRVVNIESLRKP